MLRCSYQHNYREHIHTTSYLLLLSGESMKFVYTMLTMLTLNFLGQGRPKHNRLGMHCLDLLCQKWIMYTGGLTRRISNSAWHHRFYILRHRIRVWRHWIHIWRHYVCLWPREACKFLNRRWAWCQQPEKVQRSIFISCMRLSIVNPIHVHSLGPVPTNTDKFFPRRLRRSTSFIAIQTVVCMSTLYAGVRRRCMRRVCRCTPTAIPAPYYKKRERLVFIIKSIDKLVPVGGRQMRPNASHQSYGTVPKS